MLQRIKSPMTIKNYISALTSMYRRMGFGSNAFAHTDVHRAMLAVDKSVRHIVSQAKTVTPGILRNVILVIAALRDGPTICFLLILMFMTMLRQSNFCPYSVKTFDSTRHMTRGDVSHTHRGLSVCIKWEKNLQISTAATEVIIPPTTDTMLCPVSAYYNMWMSVPTRSADQPLIMFKDNNPVTIKFLQKIWKRALVRTGQDHVRMTLHGIRSGALTYLAANSPSARDRLKDYGRWSSGAFRRYIANPSSCPIYEALATIQEKVFGRASRFLMSSIDIYLLVYETHDSNQHTLMCNKIHIINHK